MAGSEDSRFQLRFRSHAPFLVADYHKAEFSNVALSVRTHGLVPNDSIVQFKILCEPTSTPKSLYQTLLREAGFNLSGGTSVTESKTREGGASAGTKAGLAGFGVKAGVSVKEGQGSDLTTAESPIPLDFSRPQDVHAGLRLKGGFVGTLQPYGLEMGGHQAFVDETIRLSAVFARQTKLSEPLTTRAPSGANVKFERIVDEPGIIHEILKYALREMIDFRDFVYDEREPAVEFVPYNSQRRERRSAQFFVEWLDSYHAKFRPERLFPDLRGPSLVRRFGYMSDGMLAKAATRFGGSAPAHPVVCRCRSCVSWQRADGFDLRNRYEREDTC